MLIYKICQHFNCEVGALFCASWTYSKDVGSWVRYYEESKTIEKHLVENKEKGYSKISWERAKRKDTKILQLEEKI